MKDKAANIQLIATDVDGTFLTSGRVPSAQTLKAVRAALGMGVRVCACSGRNYTEIRDLCAFAGLSDLAVINNGASIVNWRTGAYMNESRFDPNRIVDMLRALLLDAKNYPSPTLSVAGGAKTHICRGYSDEAMLHRGEAKNNTSGFTAELYFIHENVEDWLNAAVEDTQRILYNLDAKRNGPRIRTLLEPYGGVCITTAAPGRMEIAPKGTSKGEGVRKLCEVYGIAPENTMAIGDGLNDESMLRFAGFRDSDGKRIAAA